MRPQPRYDQVVDALSGETATDHSRIQVRPAVADEVESVGRLTLDAYAHNGFILEKDSYAEHLLDAASRRNDAELLVAELCGHVVGTVTFCPEGSPFREAALPGEGEFRMLAVRPDARRRGVAEALVDRCIERSRELGCTALVLCTLPVQVQAHALYERLGFRRAPELDWSPAPEVDLMGFRLTL